jgi:glycerol transport system ATP-binding protein
MLELDRVSLQVNGSTYLQDISLRLERGQVNVLLGPTLSGKTSLLRVMAGLDHPSSGEIRFDDRPVNGIPVRQRNVAMVYQQFINYPTLTVFENIASPLRVAGLPGEEITARVQRAASLLHLEELLSRRPLELSGGQQQRVAIARALVKQADLVLLDEPLANLDYKLREELRGQLPRLFAEQGTVLVYATTEPAEALALGGRTACLHQGQLAQYGPTLALYNKPAILQTARNFSDPPLNVMAVNVTAGSFAGTVEGCDISALNARFAGLPGGRYRIAVRPHHLELAPASASVLRFSGRVSVTELTGSESFIHFDCADEPWVALVHGVKNLDLGADVTFYVDPDRLLLFDEDDQLVSGPAAREVA